MRCASARASRSSRATIEVRAVGNRHLQIEDVALPAAVWAAIESGEHPIRAIRKYRGLTQIDVAEQAGLRQGYIADIEAGKKTGSATSLKAIAAALGVPLDVIVG
jgi:DNA-binding XRE family transcriptional regulator